MAKFLVCLKSAFNFYKVLIPLTSILQIEPQLLSGKNVMISAHGNSLRSIIMYLDKLTSQEVAGVFRIIVAPMFSYDRTYSFFFFFHQVISLELSTGIPMLYIFKEGRFIRRGSPIGPSEAGVYAYTRVCCLYHLLYPTFRMYFTSAFISSF